MALFGTSLKDIIKWEQEEKMDKIIASLKNKNYEVRKAAVIAIGNQKEIKAFKQIAEALHDKTPDVRLEAISTLGKFGTKEAFEVLKDYNDKNPISSEWVEQALLNIHLTESSVYLFTITANKGINNKKDLKDAKYLLQIKDTSYVAHLGEFFESAPSWDIILYAIMLLKEINNPAANVSLKPLLLHGNNDIRKNAALAMAHLGETKWAELVTGSLRDDYSMIVKDGDTFLIKKIMEYLSSEKRQNLMDGSLYIYAIIHSGNKDLCKQVSEIIFKKDKSLIMTFVELFSIGENKEVVAYLKEKILKASSKDRKSIADTLEKLGDNSFKGIIEGTKDDYYNLAMANYPGINEFMLGEMKDKPKSDNKIYVETLIKIASNDYSKIKNWQNVLDIIENSHTDTSHSDHEDVGPSNSDCHSDHSNYEHTDHGVLMDFTNEQKIMLSRMKMLDSLYDKEIDDDLILKCLDNQDDGLLADLLKKYEIKSFGVFEKLLKFYLVSVNKEFRSLIEKLLFKPEEKNISIIIKMLEESKNLTFDIRLLSLLGNEALMNANLINAIITNCINNKDDAYIFELLRKIDIKSIKAIEDLARYCYVSKNQELWQVVEKLVFQRNKENMKLIAKLLDDLYSWNINKDLLLSYGDEIVEYLAVVVPGNCNMQNCSLIMNVLNELNTEKSMNVLRCFLFQKDIKIRGEAYKILMQKGENWYATAEDKDKVLIEKRDARLVFAFKHMYHAVLPQFKKKFLETLYEFADDEILELVLSDFDYCDWPIIMKIAAKVKSERSTGFLEEQLNATYNEDIRAIAAEALFERGDERWKGKINGNDNDFMVLAQAQDDKIINGLIHIENKQLNIIIDAFGKSGNPLAYDALIKISERGDFMHREELYKAFENLNDKRAIPILKKALFFDNPGLRKIAAEALSVIEAGFWKEIFTGDENDYLRLANFPNNDTIDILKELLADKSPIRRKQAAEAFVGIAKKDFNMVSSIWKDYAAKISEVHIDSTKHIDHWASTHSGDCHSDESTHTDSGIGVQIPEDLKL